VLAPAASALWAASCAAALGPGYTIEKQQIRVRFEPAPEPRILLAADYQLKNTGNQPLHELELRLPGRRRFHYDSPGAKWDSAAVTLQASAENPRDTAIVFPQPWATTARHTLHLSVEYLPPVAGETSLSFSKDAFFLPAQGWSPELLPARGLFATGGVPPKRWELLVAVPQGFQVHTSGAQKKSVEKAGEFTVLAEQTTKDAYPFVIAGRYKTADIGKGKEKVRLWTVEQQESVQLRGLSDALTRVIAAYNAAFGERSNESSQTWIVECPAVVGCFTNLSPALAKLLGEEEKQPATAEVISPDTLVVDLSGGVPKLAAAAAPALASSWLGYGQSPGFYEQGPPLTAFPQFAASIGRDAAEGADTRAETIRRALRLIPAKAASEEQERQAVLRAKSFLFFYALQDRYGQEAFRRAVNHMLYARRGRNFELSDLIAAFEQETHQNVAEFVRIWMKRPGVPEDFRARYGESAARAQSDKETTP